MQPILKDISILSMIAFLSTILFFGLLITGCSSSAGYLPDKMDTPLKQKILMHEKNNIEESIRFNCRTSMPLTDNQKDQIKGAGIKVESTIGEFFTGSGKAGSIKELTLFDFVVYLELAQRLEIKN